MGQRTSIAKALRDDDIQYLKALASGKVAEKHVEKIVGDYRLSYKLDVLFPIFVACGIGGVCTLRSFGNVLHTESLLRTGIAWFCFVMLVLYRAFLIRDYRTAEKIYPDINIILGAHTEFIPSWTCFPISIGFVILYSILFALSIYNY